MDTVVSGKIPLPALRIEYETREQEPGKVDLKLATGHHKRSQFVKKRSQDFFNIPPSTSSSGMFLSPCGFLLLHRRGIDCHAGV